MPACGRATQCQRHRMSCSNPYTLACIWTIISIFTFADRRDIFSSESTKAVTSSRKSRFKISPCSARTRSLLWQSALQGTASIKCLSRGLQCPFSDPGLAHPVTSSSPSELSDISALHPVPWRVLLEAQIFHSLQTLLWCFTFSSVKLFSRVRGSGGSGNQRKWLECLSSLTCSGLPGMFTSPSALLLCLASYVWNNL